MKTLAIFASTPLLLAVFFAPAQLPVLNSSDVVFMYQASRQT